MRAIVSWTSPNIFHTLSLACNFLQTWWSVDRSAGLFEISPDNFYWNDVLNGSVFCQKNCVINLNTVIYYKRYALCSSYDHRSSSVFLSLSSQNIFSQVIGLVTWCGHEAVALPALFNYLTEKITSLPFVERIFFLSSTLNFHCIASSQFVNHDKISG